MLVKVLFAVSECVPFIKSGGLADVAGSLPKELKKTWYGCTCHDAEIWYISEEFQQEMKKIAEFTVQCWMAKSVLWD